MLSVGGMRTIWLSLLGSVLVATIPAQFGGTAYASTVDLWSQAANGSNNVTGTNVSVLVSPVWATPSGPGIEWILSLIHISSLRSSYSGLRMAYCAPSNSINISRKGAPIWTALMPRPKPCARRKSWSVARRSSKTGMASEGALTGAETLRNNGSPSCRMRREGITYEDITAAFLRREWWTVDGG